MAKAKKEDSIKTSASKKAPAALKQPSAQPAQKAAGAKKPAAAKTAASAKAAAGAKQPAKAGKPAAAPQSPLIDTGLAAQTAAAMVANRLASTGGSSTPPAQEQESSAFRDFKKGLNKPSAGSFGGILGAGSGQKKFGSGFGGPKQSGPGGPGGRNQTFGADVNRSGVPRRTGG